LPRGGTFWDVGANVAKVKGKFAPHAALMLRHPTASNMTLNRQQEKREDNPSRLDPIACRVLLVIGGGVITGTLVFVLTASTFDSCSIERGSRATWPPLHGAVRHCAAPTATPRSSLRARSQSSWSPPVGVATIRRAELSERETFMTVPNDVAVRRALEAAGVEFIDENGGGGRVRLRKQKGFDRMRD
jgi:hypothetical protein